MKNYQLKNEHSRIDSPQGAATPPAISAWAAFRKMFAFMSEERVHLGYALIALTINAGLVLVGPFMVGYVINHYIQYRHFSGVLLFGGILLMVYLVAFVANYIQIKIMGGVGQRVLFKVRNALFAKLQELPVAFFNQNKAGDLISRINSDTEKLNMFFSQTLVQFTSNLFIIAGAGIFILAINLRLALVALAPAVGILIFMRIAAGLVKKLNLRTLQANGAMSSEIQESLSNFKVIVAFNRRDYFRDKFKSSNLANFKASIKSGLMNSLFGPVFDFFSNIAQLLVLAYGIYLIMHGQLQVGFLISFIIYISRFYDPLRQFAGLWSTLQVALAGWTRVSEILALETDLQVLSTDEAADGRESQAPAHLMELKDVSFEYAPEKMVLSHVSFRFETGKTYALVGPTGGGKTTTASLIARLFDPTEGVVLLEGKDLRTYSSEERTAAIGFILQEPFLLTGTVRDNLVYGSELLASMTEEGFGSLVKERGLDTLLVRFESGLATEVTGGETMSLGQRQLIAFMRAVLRSPKLLVLDEATANIDTVTEQLLEEALAKLPATTTKIIIAHRLNTIESADEIFFVNGGRVTEAGSMEHAVEMLLHGKRES